MVSGMMRHTVWHMMLNTVSDIPQSANLRKCGVERLGGAATVQQLRTDRAATANKPATTVSDVCGQRADNVREVAPNVRPTCSQRARSGFVHRRT